jgi:hypothetical protein
MKWRTSGIYLLVLLLIGGYFYYFEVVKKEQKEAAEQESRRALTFNAEAVKTIEILAGEAKPVHLEKQDKWRISAPLDTDVDRAAFDSFFSALKNLERERKLESALPDLQTFGLRNPPLKIRIQSGEQWTELLLGEKNPTGESRYAMTSASGDIFLVSRRNWDALNKSLKDLRKKELFSWQPEQVTALEVKWGSGDGFAIEREDGSKEWKATRRRDLNIKGSKVEDLLNQLHWLRATDFLEETDATDPLYVTISLQFKDSDQMILRFGEADPNTKQTIASISGNPFLVKVASHFFKDVPKSWDSLTDRSLLPGELDAVTRVKWKIEGKEGSVVKIDADTWGTRQGEAAPKALKDSLPAKSLLGDASSVEYIDEYSPGPDFPADTTNFVEFWGSDKKLSSFAWTKLPASPDETAVIRLESYGETRTVSLLYESMGRVKNSLDELVKMAGGKD